MKKTYVYIVLVILLIVCAIVAISFNKHGKTPEETTSTEEQPINTTVLATEAPIPVEQVIEEFNEELTEEDEPIDPESFSDFTEEYVIELQEDEVVSIN